MALGPSLSASTCSDQKGFLKKQGRDSTQEQHWGGGGSAHATRRPPEDCTRSPEAQRQELCRSRAPSTEPMLEPTMLERVCAGKGSHALGQD